MLDKNSQLWSYLSEGQRSLITEGEYLFEDARLKLPIHPLTDYSYVVFPFAKAYEGFLKQFFLDLKFIKLWQYESDHFRIGKVLSPFLQKRLKKNSVYGQLIDRFGDSTLADALWNGWKQGRNTIFHYFPHNLHAVTFPQAEHIIEELLRVMEQAIQTSLTVPAEKSLQVPVLRNHHNTLYYGKSW